MRNTRFKELIQKYIGLLVSIYLPTHRSSPDNKEDVLIYKRLLKQAEEEYKRKSESDSTRFFENAREIQNNEEFWDRSSEGLALFISNELTQLYPLQGKVKEKVVVGNCFHLMPLFNYYEIPTEYYLVDIYGDGFNIFIFAKGELRELYTPDIHKNYRDLLKDKDFESNINFTGSTSNSLPGQKSQPEDDYKNTEKYFRYVEGELNRCIKRISLPVVLFGTKENILLFSKTAESIEIYETIEKPFKSLNPDDILGILKEKLLPRFIIGMERRIERLKREIAENRGTKDYRQIEKESKSGRIETLFVEKEFEAKELDEIITDIYRDYGKILVVDREQNDFDMDIAAVYRY